MSSRKMAHLLLKNSKMFVVVGIFEDRLEAIAGGGITGNEDDPLTIHTRSLLDMLVSKIPLVNDLHDKYISQKNQNDLVEKAKAKRSAILKGSL